MKNVVILFFLFLSTFSLLAKQEFVIPKMEISPVIDGVISEGEWDHALKFDKSYQIIIEDNIEPTEKTEFYLGYDDENIYVLGKCYMQNKDDITVYHCERDAIARTDRIIIHLDTFLSNDKAYRIGTNILGGKEDAIYTNNGYDMSIDIPFDSKGNLTDFGYVLEIAILLRNLKYKSGKNVKWGGYLRRETMKNRKNNHEIVSPFPFSKNSSSRFDDYPIFIFEDLPTNRNLKIIPSFITSYSEDSDEITDIKDTNKKFSPEINIFFEPNSYLTSTITVNPDFNIIEADALNIEVNNRFPIFYGEKRPFFIEQTNPFEIPINIFHTRNIIEPLWGVKAGGEIGRYSFYGLAAMDEDAPGERFFENYEGDNSNTLFCFSGLTRQLTSDGSMLRTAATLRKFENYYNYVLSLDNNIRFWKNFTWENQLVASQDKTIEDKAENGFSFYESLSFYNKNWSIFCSAKGISPLFKADLGYIPEPDIRSYYNYSGYSQFHDESSNIRKIVYGTESWIKYDYSNTDMIEWSVEPEIDIYLRNKITLDISADKHKILFGEEYHDTHSISSSVSINTFNTFGGNFWLTAGKSLWYDWDNPVIENSLEYGSWLYYRPNRHIDVSLCAYNEELETFYNAQTYELRAKYQFNENLWIRGIFQICDTEYEIFDEDYRFINLYPLFAYQPNANISLYLGVTDSDDEGKDKIENTKFLDSKSTSYFFKISYAFDVM
jgi:hypothetical protein